MDDTAKYLIHARIAADGVVERSDVVGAVFGQTEGLLGDELDLRDLQQSSKVGRIDVEISSENGQSFGELTIATSLDKAETAVLGASLETIERVGPCRASIEVTSIEDVRAAKRRAVVDRAKELLATAFDETSVSSEEILTDVRESAQVEEITEYAGLPAGPSVASSDAIIIVEGRADVLQLLKHGIKNAIGVEGTNVPDAVASLTAEKTVTVFVDGDRGGELILRELMQVGDVDYVVFAPADQSVEDLSREAVHGLLREKIAADRLGDVQNMRETIAGLVETSGIDSVPNDDATQSTETATASESTASTTESPTEVEVIPTSSTETGEASAERSTQSPGSEPPPAVDSEPSHASATATESASTEAVSTETTASPSTETETEGITETTEAETDETTEAETDETTEAETDETTEAETDEITETTEAETDETSATLQRHMQEVIDARTGTARLLSESFALLAEVEPDELVSRLETTEEAFALVFDGELTQQLLDVATQSDLDHIVARSTGEFVKQPVGTRVLTAEQLRAAEVDVEA